MRSGIHAEQCSAYVQRDEEWNRATHSSRRGDLERGGFDCGDREASGSAYVDVSVDVSVDRSTTSSRQLLVLYGTVIQ